MEVELIERSDAEVLAQRDGQALVGRWVRDVVLRRGDGWLFNVPF